MLFQPPGPANRPRPALLSRPRMMLSQLAGSPVLLRPAVVLHELATYSTEPRCETFPRFMCTGCSLDPFGSPDPPAAHLFEARSVRHRHSASACLMVVFHLCGCLETGR